MAAFDENKLDTTTYNLSDPIESIRYQSVVEEFMDIVRQRPAYLVGRRHLFDMFGRFLDDENAWPLAVAVVPEFHEYNNIDTTKPTAINIVLKSLKHRLPTPPVDDPSGNEERLLVKRRVNEATDYIVGCGRSTLTEEERREANDLVARALPVIGMSTHTALFAP